jgi:hypothetical protein
MTVRSATWRKIGAGHQLTVRFICESGTELKAKWSKVRDNFWPYQSDTGPGAPVTITAVTEEGK